MNNFDRFYEIFLKIKVINEYPKAFLAEIFSLLFSAERMTWLENVPVAQLFDTILILDFGSQYTHLIASGVRELGVYCELFARTARLSDIPFEAKGVILSESPYSVYTQDSPHVDPAGSELNCPILGTCLRC